MPWVGIDFYDFKTFLSLAETFLLKVSWTNGRLIYAWPGVLSYSVIQRPGLAHWGQIRGRGVRMANLSPWVELAQIHTTGL